MCPRNRRKPQPPLGIGDLRAPINRAVFNRAGPLAAVQNRSNGYPRRHQLPRHHPRAIVVGKQRHTFSRHDTIAVQIGLHRRRHHNAGAVVHRERNRALRRPGRQNGLARRNAPKTFARQICGRYQMQADTFQRRINAAIIHTRHGGARHDPHIGQTAQFNQSCLQPARIGDQSVIRQKPPAARPVFFGQDHICARSARHQRRHQARWPRTHHQQIAKRIGFFVMCGVRRA